MTFYENNKLWMQGKARDYLRENPYVYNQFEYVNNDDLYFNGGKKRDNWYRVEGVFSLGGYVFKDRLWFFGSINPIYSQTEALRDFNQRQGPWYQFLNKNYTYNGSIKLTLSPMTGLRVTASYVNNFYKYRGSIPAITGTSSATTEWYKDGYDYPNFTTAATVDYTASNNLLLSLRTGWHRQNTTNQQVAPPDYTTYYFNVGNINAGYSSDPFYVAHPELLRNTGWRNYTTRLQLLRQIYDKVSANLDATYYANFMGEHAFKAGAQFIYLHEDVYNGAIHPMVNLYFGRTYTRMGFPVGVGAPPDSPYYGKYGYYIIRHSFISEYGWVWNIHSNNWALYAQDSWTLNNKLTINFGLRTEYEYIPSFASNDPELAKVKPIEFKFQDKLAPRLGVVYDVFGDSSLKLFASYGIYYDVMKLYMAEGAFGGFKWWDSVYALQNPDWTQIAASGDRLDQVSQAAGGTYAGSWNNRAVSFDTIDPDLKPVAQREISLGVEKKLMEDLSLSVRLVQKHLIRTIEDVGVYVFDPETGLAAEEYYIANPGYGWTLPQSQGGKFADKITDPDTGIEYTYWPEPKAKREYYGLNLSLEKRFSKNWQGGINYTLSRVQGNYGGLSSPDEGGRNSPNVERYWDLWFMQYQIDGKELDGPLPQDRTHYLRAYGSYVFPFGLTIGITAYARSGYPLSSWLNINGTYMYPYGYGDLGRLPWGAWADLFIEYNLRFGGKYNAAINLQINNVTNSKFITGKVTTLNRQSIYADDWEFLNGSLAQTLNDRITAEGEPHPAFLWWTGRNGPFSVRLGFKFTF